MIREALNKGAEEQHCVSWTCLPYYRHLSHYMHTHLQKYIEPLHAHTFAGVH